MLLQHAGDKYPKRFFPRFSITNYNSPLLSYTKPVILRDIGVSLPPFTPIVHVCNYHLSPFLPVVIAVYLPSIVLCLNCYYAVLRHYDMVDLSCTMLRRQYNVIDYGIFIRQLHQNIMNIRFPSLSFLFWRIIPSQKYRKRNE